MIIVPLKKSGYKDVAELELVLKKHNDTLKKTGIKSISGRWSSMRKSIFDIAAESIDMESETNRLVAMSSEKDVLVIGSYPYKTLFDYVDGYCFKDRAQRSDFIDVDDFLQALEFEDLKDEAAYNVDAF